VTRRSNRVNASDAPHETDLTVTPGSDESDEGATDLEDGKSRVERRVMTRRAREARPPLVVRPSFVSQETAYAILGIPPRKFLDVIVPTCAGTVIRVGRSVLITLEAAENALRQRSTRTDGHISEDDRDGAQATSVDAVLASVGVRRVGR